jgi:hypothetical protein
LIVSISLSEQYSRGEKPSEDITFSFDKYERVNKRNSRRNHRNLSKIIVLQIYSGILCTQKQNVGVLRRL